MNNTAYELIAIPNEKTFYLDYDHLHPVDDGQHKFEAKLKDDFKINPRLTLFMLGLVPKGTKMSMTLKYFYQISKYFINQLIAIPDLDEVKDQVKINFDEEKMEYFLRISPFINRNYYINKNWLKEIWSLIHEGYYHLISELTSPLSTFLYKKDKSLMNYGKVCFHLVENKIDRTQFAFMASYQVYDINTSRIKNMSLKKVLHQSTNNLEQSLKILGPISTVASQSSFIKELLDQGEIFYPLTLDKDEAFTFLTEIPLYEKANIICRIPNWWQKKYKTKVNVIIANRKSYLNFNELADFEVQMYLGNLKIEIDELNDIIKLGSGLVQYKGEWIQIDEEKLNELKTAYLNVVNKLDNDDYTLFNALKLELGETIINQTSDVMVEIEQGEWIKTKLNHLITQKYLEEVTLGNDFKAILRPYQIIGLNWLETMKKLGLGCCLADDMGLGKTIQVLAWLNSRRNHNERSLLVVPASLIGNWISEIKRFSPNLNYLVVHSSFETFKNKEMASFDLIITSYQMLDKDKFFKNTQWDNLILDEAQAIKNASTMQAKNAKSINANYRIALTGTPIENRLDDLWSLFDFLNKGILGNSRQFKSFVKQMTDDDTSYDKLRQQIKPFILRRLKTDKTIINDLPDKIESKVYANLSKRQIALYLEVFNDLKNKIEQFEGINRKGLILQSIIKFKQICNHPAQYLGEDEYLLEDSGKFSLLKDLCDTIAESRERVLVFTQFSEITLFLDDFLATIFGKRGLILTGETPIKKRKELVDIFQGDEYIPYFIITVKAGGVGLNLTKANHVIHFDRWWNPSVENQATDRAFRIGQKNNVLVYKFITQSTVEEKIDAMMMDKTALANSLINDQHEVSITSLSNQELLNLFKIES